MPPVGFRGCKERGERRGGINQPLVVCAFASASVFSSSHVGFVCVSTCLVVVAVEDPSFGVLSQYNVY